MRYFKFIAGMGCFISAANLGLFVLGGYPVLPFAICACGFAAVGWFLMSKRRLPFSTVDKVSMTSAFCLLIGLVIVFVIPNFVRAKYQTVANSCINNLRQIEGAKEEWALENGKPNGTVVTENDIKPYIKLDANGNLPRCGNGGAYGIGRVGETPKCSIGTTRWPNYHVLPDDDVRDDWWTDFKGAYGLLLGFHRVHQP